ncbi:branched-chain amino acid aminotransferase [Thalassoroseus pseudoceratinae]|uniref:branched-chain amino acid aminotransferase n=1 Tax=Thalassoroseus pseudoceratinae TaxID=2713176 RepID=UPI00141EAC2A|nr:branched-chain amino acid aminotransferase [Thalassoroseus pseudoceratinae]
MNLLTTLWADEAGFVVSAELILVCTILVLGLVVGLAEVGTGVNEEMEDVGSAIGSVNQSYSFTGFTGFKGDLSGSIFYDQKDDGDTEFDVRCDGGVQKEFGYSY